MLDIVSCLVGHRGYPARYPENTLPGLTAAIEAGARYVEFDIQLSRDRIPVLCHDATLLRTAGLDRRVMDLDARELEFVDVGEATRLGPHFKSTSIPRLSTVLNLLSTHPSVHAFVEIKQESLGHFGVQTVMEAIMNDLSNHTANCTPISFNPDCLLFARQQGAQRIGWAVEQAGEQVSATLDNLKPEFLFTADGCFDAMRNTLSGAWKWAVYQTDVPKRALELFQHGAHLVETNAIGELLPALTRIS